MNCYVRLAGECLVFIYVMGSRRLSGIAQALKLFSSGFFLGAVRITINHSCIILNMYGAVACKGLKVNAENQADYD